MGEAGFSEKKIVGVMSGTSLDGLDLAYCVFSGKPPHIEYKILSAVTIEYPEIWQQRLTGIKDASAEKYFALNHLYGRFIGEKINGFLSENGLQAPDAIASHGHTVFHQPHAGFSTQIGCGASIAAVTGIDTINDFRSLDVAYEGQGAPLVPVGDEYLFSEYDACLNIGGIANISYKSGKKRVAYDLCAANMLLNWLAEQKGFKYDKDGEMARSGNIIPEVLERIHALPYFALTGVKSTGREWFERSVMPEFAAASHSTEDLLATATEHIAVVIADDLKKQQPANVLATGGGALNKFLIEKISGKSNSELVVPDLTTINFKEALIFAFLGYLRLNNHVNSLSSVTGAKKDSCGGVIYLA